MLDYLGVHGTSLYDGQSLFRKTNDQVTVIEENGSRDPYQFCIQAEKKKSWFQYRDNWWPIALQSDIYLKKVTDDDDHILPVDETTVEGRRFVRETFDEGLRQLFPFIKL